MISPRRFWWVLVATLVLASAANAQIVLYGNLNATILGYDSVDYSGPLYNSFSTGSSPVLLTDVKVYLDLVDGAWGSVLLGLYADNGTYPGALLKTIGTINDDSIDASGGIYDFPVSPGYALTANTRYWLGLSTSDASLAGWASTIGGDGTGNIGNEYSCRVSPPPAGFQISRLVGQLSCTSNSVDPYLMQITATPPAPVPTLSTWGMLGLALLLMASSAWLIRRAQTSGS